MLDAFIVIREERHVDNRYWVCLQKEDALSIASEVTAYWRNVYEPEPDDIDESLYEGQLFNFDADDCFRVTVQPQTIREPGEVK